MTHLELSRQQEISRARTAGHSHREPVPHPVDRGAVIQWTTVGVVGLLLGLYLPWVMSLSSPWPPLLIIAALVPFVAMILGDARRMLLAATVLDIPFQWGVHLNYDAAAGNMGALGGLGISVTTASILALYVLWFAELLANRDSAYHPWVRATLPLAAYVAMAALSMLVARDAGFALDEVFLLVQTLLLYIYIVSTVRTRQDIGFLATMLVVGLLMESLVMLGLHFLGSGLRIPGITTHLDATTAVAASASPVSRDIGTFGSPNVAASFLSLLLVPSFALILMKVSNARKALALGAFALGALSILLTFSRGGWLAFAVSMALFSTFAIRRRYLSIVGPVAVLVAGAALFLIFQEPILARLSDSEAAAGRVPLIALALSMIQAHPWLGVGSNNFYVVMPDYLTPDFAGAWLYVVHDKYLLVWAETGIFALIAFVIFLLATVYRGWLVWRRNDPFLSPLALAFTAVVIGQMVHMNFDIFNGQPQVQGLWLVAALLAAMSNIQSGEKNGAK
jgi:putative inorganic carbon (hco3(-)) transporter